MDAVVRRARRAFLSGVHARTHDARSRSQDNRSSKRRAVIVDVDETIIDNSRYQAWLLKNGQSFNDQTWLEWINRAEATAIPGALEFLKYANSRGVRVFYITNRKTVEKEGTASQSAEAWLSERQR